MRYKEIWSFYHPYGYGKGKWSHSVMSDSLRPHGVQHTRLLCPSPTPGACSNSHPSCQWCHPTISSSVIPFSSCLQSFPASGCFQMSQLFTSGGQSIGASASVLAMNIQDWFPLGLTLTCLSNSHERFCCRIQEQCPSGDGVIYFSRTCGEP